MKKYTIIFITILALLISACATKNEAEEVAEAATNAPIALVDNTGSDAASAESATSTSSDNDVPDPNPALKLPFTDNFDTGLDSAWRILSGNPVVANGKLGSAPGKEVYLEIGNNELRDYTVTVEVTGGDYAWDGHLYLTLTPSLQVHISSNAYYTRIQWLAFADNKWDEINTVKFDAADASNFKVTVSGRNYAVYANGQLVSELVYGSPPETGSPLIVQIYGRYIWLDDFSIH